MKHVFIALALLFVMLLALAPLSFAAGINLSWNDCGTFGQCNQSFACDTNGPGTFTLVGSFVPPAGVTQLIGVEIILDLVANSPTVPDWWQFKNAGTCRTTAINSSFSFVGGPYSCTDYWEGQAQGGIASYQVGAAIGSGYPANLGRILIAGSMPSEFVHGLDENTEYYAFKLLVSKSKTVGTGACGGCDVPVGFLLEQVRLHQPVGVGDYTLQYQDSYQMAAWQNGQFSVYDVGYNCPPVPARNKTWGALKSLYR